MKKVILLILLVLPFKLFAQRFSQYYTNTLYDSFENPAQRAFIPDSSKQYAFNFLMPNFNSTLYLTGNAQSTLKQRAFLSSYNNANLEIGARKNNYLNLNTNVYIGMFKLFASLNGDQEVGFFLQMKNEGKARFTDESVAIFNGYTSFTNTSYDDVFNDNFKLQNYYQLGFTYREKINKKFAIGFKLGANLGVAYNELTVDQSNITFDRLNNQAYLTLKGAYYTNKLPGDLGGRDLVPSLKNPGLSMSVGATYRTDRGINLQANIKDFGFIHWGKKSSVYLVNSTGVIEGLNSRGKEDSVYSTIKRMAQQNLINDSFTTATDGRIEVSASKSYILTYDKKLKYTPAFILSKQLFNDGISGALVNHLQYKKVVGTITASLDEMDLFNFGGQIMIKSPNAEFFIGSERLFQSVGLYRAYRDNPNYINKNGAFTGADIFLGFSVKFGRDIEHPMNSSVIPMGEEKGFIGRLWDKIIKPKPVKN